LEDTKLSKVGKIITGAVIVTAAVFTGGAAAAALTSFTMGAAVTNALIAGISTLALGGLSALTTKGNKAGTQNFGTKVAARGSSVPRQIIYGQCRVGGTITQMHSTGTDNVKLCTFVVLAGHRINGLVKLRINDVEATTTSATVSGETVHTVTNSDFTNADNDHDFGSGRLIRFTFHDGQQTAHDGLARASLGSTFVPDTHTFTGCAYAYIEMIYDQEKLSSMPNLSFEVQGALVFDPRDDSTAYNDNPALCIRDYLTNTTYGLKCESSEINDAQSGGGFYSAAATCDTNVTLADNTTTTHTYFCGGFFSMADSGEEVLDTLLTSCAGNITYTNGKFNLFVGAAQTPSLTVTDSDILEPVTMQTKPANGNMYNQVKALFVDSTAAYKPTDTPIFSSSAFLTEDTPDDDSNDYPNYRKMMEIRLPITTASEAAQRIARIALNQSRYTLNISVLVGLNFLKAQPHDWVYVTNERMGWTQKTFEIVSMNVEPISSTTDTEILGVRLYLRETHPDIYAFLYNAYTTPIASATGLATSHVKNVGTSNLIDQSVVTNIVADDAITQTSIAASSVTSFSSGSTGTQALTVSMAQGGTNYTGDVIVIAYVIPSGTPDVAFAPILSGSTVVGRVIGDVSGWDGSNYTFAGRADSTMRLYLNPTSVGTNAGTNMTLMSSYTNISIYTLTQPVTLFGRSTIDATQLASAASFTAKVTLGVNNWNNPALQVIWTVFRRFK
jgi:hypothetical protein